MKRYKLLAVLSLWLLLLGPFVAKAQTAPTYGPGKFGNDVNFNCDSGYDIDNLSTAVSSASNSTIEGFINTTVTGTAQTFAVIGGASGPNYTFGVDASGNFVGSVPYAGSPSFSVTGNIANGAYHHIAYVHTSTSTTLYIDGVLRQTINGTTLALSNGSSSFGYISSVNTPFAGHLDELRISSIARYVGSSFTVPTAAFPDADNSTIALYHFDSNANNTATGVVSTGGSGSGTTAPGVDKIASTQLTGTLTGPDGRLFNGQLILSVAAQVRISSLGNCGGPLLIAPQVPVIINIKDGTAAWPKVFGVDCMIAPKMPYNATLKDQQGNTLFNTKWTIAGITEDVGTLYVAATSAVSSTYASIVYGQGAPAGTCVAQAFYIQTDNIAGKNLYSCINGNWVQQSGTPGDLGPTGCIIGYTCQTDVALSSLNGYEVHFQQPNFPGTTPDAQLKAAQDAFTGNSAPLIFVMDYPADFINSVDLENKNSLELRADAHFQAGVHINTKGNNTILCKTGARLLTDTADSFIVSATSGDNVRVSCDAVGAGGNSQVLKAVGVNHTRVDNMLLSRIGAASVSGGQDHSFSTIFITDPTPYGTAYGYVVAGDATYVSGTNMKVTNVANGVEWFNTDADFNKGGPTNRTTVLSHGGWYNFSGIDCNTVRACTWGSVAHDVTVENSHALGCADVCFDSEGNVDVHFVYTSCKEAINGCGTTFFFADNVSFDNSDYSSLTGKPLISVYNSSQDPNLNIGMKVRGGTLHCETVQCMALGGDAQTGVVVEGVQIKNGFLSSRNFQGQWTIRGNHWTGDVAQYSPITLSGMKALGTTVIDGNLFESTTTQAANTPAIFISNNDFNTPVNVQVTNNRNLSGFTQDWKFTSASGNAGIGMNVTLDGNYDRTGGAIFSGFGARDQVAISSYMVPSGSVYKRIVDAAATLGSGNGVGENIGTRTVSGFFVCSADGKFYTKTTPCQ